MKSMSFYSRKSRHLVCIALSVNKNNRTETSCLKSQAIHFSVNSVLLTYIKIKTIPNS